MVTHSKPPIFDKCEKEFGITWDNTIFAYLPNIHAKYSLTDDLIEHEMVHLKQQQELGDVENWWQIYFDDPPQRLKWELEAYRRQYNFLKAKISRNELFDKVHSWSSMLSGKFYGYLIDYREAIKEITT